MRKGSKMWQIVHEALKVFDLFYGVLSNALWNIFASFCSQMVFGQVRAPVGIVFGSGGVNQFARTVPGATPVAGVQASLRTSSVLPIRVPGSYIDREINAAVDMAVLQVDAGKIGLLC